MQKNIFLLMIATIFLSFAHSIALAQSSSTKRLNELLELQQNSKAIDEKLNLLEGKFIKIDFENKVPFVYCVFVNKSNLEVSVYGTRITIHENNDNNTGWMCSKGSNLKTVIKPNDSILVKCEMRNINYKKMKFPITNPEKYNLQVVYYCDLIKLGDETYNRFEFSKKNEKELKSLLNN